MKLLVLFAVLLIAIPAGAQFLDARALLSYEDYGLNDLTRSGFRQTYDFRLSHGLTDTSQFHIFFHGDDFRGHAVSTVRNDVADSRQLQPGGDIVLSTDTLAGLARAEYYDISSRTGDFASSRTISRAIGNVVWSPTALPVFKLIAQRTDTNDPAGSIHLLDRSTFESIDYGWRGVHGIAQNLYSTSNDPGQGYDRRSDAQTLELLYSGSHFHDKLLVMIDGTGQWMRTDQAATGNGPTSVPAPVPIMRVSYTIDETPIDNRDHPPQPAPLLNDNDFNTSAGFSLGPDGASFQNFILDLNRTDQMDELRIVVRDPVGNPLRNGGGGVIFDLYTSQDGVLWTLQTSETSFNNSLSLYSVTFTPIAGRWFKIVSFGVNVDPTLVTEIQAFFHTIIAPGQLLRSNQSTASQTANISYHPITKLSLLYSGFYTATRQELALQPLQRTTSVEHMLWGQYDVLRQLALRAQYLKRDAKTYTGLPNTGDGMTGFVDYMPTKDLKLTLEVGRESDVFEGSAYNLDTQALHLNAYVLRSFIVTADVGRQKQFIESDQSMADRKYADLTSTMQLLPSLRMLLAGSYERTRSESSDPTVQLLGAPRDERFTDTFLWRPSHELNLSVQVGYLAGQAISGFTGRYRVEWYPFADGTVSLAGTYDDDIDPTQNRRAKRATFNPRWLMNRHAWLELNYTNVSTTIASLTDQQHSLFFTLTLSK